VNADVQSGAIDVGTPPARFDDRILELFKKVEIYTIAPNELAQFAYEFDVEIDGDKVILTTEEIDVSAFLKVLINGGARIEVFSAHDYPNSEHGRGR
jgi:hypothetical protein